MIRHFNGISRSGKQHGTICKTARASWIHETRLSCFVLLHTIPWKRHSQLAPGWRPAQTFEPSVSGYRDFVSCRHLYPLSTRCPMQNTVAHFHRVAPDTVLRSDVVCALVSTARAHCLQGCASAAWQRCNIEFYTLDSGAVCGALKAGRCTGGDWLNSSSRYN